MTRSKLQLFQVIRRVRGLVGLAVGMAVWGAAVLQAGEVGENLALGRPYRLFPAPNYRHCTDPGDTVQLTDGHTTDSYFWTQIGTVVWQNVHYATITVDLGDIHPIGGVSMTTAAGTANVTWPMAVPILVSDDGQEFFKVGDLVAQDQAVQGPWPEGYAIRQMSTDQLEARGRYVQFVMIPLPGGPYLFTVAEAGDRGEPVGRGVAYGVGSGARAVAGRWSGPDRGARGISSCLAVLSEWIPEQP